MNNYQQISLFDSLGFLSECKQKILDKSWAKPFSDHIFSNIDEMLFAPPYSDKRNFRPNAPINVIVGALILKEFNCLTDDEILEECEFDFRYQYALHTIGYEDQPLSDIEGLNDYVDPNNRNRVIYHDQSTPQNEKIQKVINDAVFLLPKCRDGYGQTDDYRLLQKRAIDEQTKKDDKGGRVPKNKEDGMTPDILQNPSDPDATYRSKAGRFHKGYCANLIEAVDEKGSVTVDYQYDVNTRSDASFIKEYLENSEDAFWSLRSFWMTRRGLL